MKKYYSKNLNMIVYTLNGYLMSRVNKNIIQNKVCFVNIQDKQHKKIKHKKPGAAIPDNLVT